MHRIFVAAALLYAVFPLITPVAAQQGSVSTVRQTESSPSQPRTARAQQRPTTPDAIERMTELPSRQPAPPRMEVAPLPSSTATGRSGPPSPPSPQRSQTSSHTVPLVGGHSVPLVLTPPPVTPTHSSPPSREHSPGETPSTPQITTDRRASPPVADKSASPPRDRRQLHHHNVEAAQRLASSAQSTRIDGVWIARQGQTLRATLEAWAREAGWRIAWRADHEYTLMASAEFQGSFEDAAGTLIEAFANASPPIFGRLYTGNRVLVITNPQDADLN